MLSHFKELFSDYIPVVRRAKVKLRKSANEEIYAKAQVSDEELQKFMVALKTKDRAILSINVDVVDSTNTITMNASIEWFIQKLKQ